MKYCPTLVSHCASTLSADSFSGYDAGGDSLTLCLALMPCTKVSHCSEFDID